jgi:hypothetical protein
VLAAVCMVPSVQSSDDEHSSTSLSLKCAHDIASTSHMIEIDLALTREAAGHRSGCAVCATTSYAQLRSLNLSTGPLRLRRNFQRT